MFKISQLIWGDKRKPEAKLRQGGQEPNKRSSCTRTERGRQEQAEPGYRYFLVFQDKDISMTGVYPMSEFLKIPAEL